MEHEHKPHTAEGKDTGLVGGIKGTAMDFSNRTEKLLGNAEEFCNRRGVRLTDIRRKVLGLIFEAGKPVGAYDLLDQMRQTHKGSAPPTVYRALDFLMETGLIHRIERLAAFVGCTHSIDHDHGHDSHDHDAFHAAQFLICRECGAVVELEDEQITRALLAASKRNGFSVAHSTIEAEGLCAACQALARGRPVDRDVHAGHQADSGA